MKIIVDSNIVYSGILNTQSAIGDILLNTGDLIEFYTCEYLRAEIDNHQNEILKATGYDGTELHEVQFKIYSKLTFFTEALLPFECWQEAANFVRDVDIDDIAFVALSLFLDAKLWTGDKKLREGLLKKGFQNLISASEIISLLREHNP
ncbi:MAG: PIN domain-containing protein [Saprospiraceae bacterium]|nr:PIN domain-containing protein [Saprospiraceae bacterium]